MRQPAARIPHRLLAVEKPAVVATPVERVAAQPAEAGAEEEPPGTDTQHWGFAESPAHNWCKMRRHRRAVFHISDKTLFPSQTVRVPLKIKIIGLAHATYPETSRSTRKCRRPVRVPLRQRCFAAIRPTM